MNELRSDVRLIEVAPQYVGQRIDNYLLRVLKGVPKSRIYRILRRGEVRVNRGRVQPDYRIQGGDQIRIPPLRLSPGPAEVFPPRFLTEQLNNTVLWEDHEVLVLNKPAGIAVHGGSGVDFGVIEILRVLRPDLPFLELTHRLDRETSGCLTLAKTPAVLRAIQAAHQTNAVDKRYLTLVRAHWERGVVSVDAPLRKYVLRGGERMVGVLEDGKRANTHFKPISLFQQASLVEVMITTGRTHQIRVHAAYIGHPIAGDEKYGNVFFNREMARHGLHRLFLHAHSISFPLGNREISVCAPLNKELKHVLEQLDMNR
jgi:23S rRNA pseudouridine955/2504/2580 synthase